MAPGVMTLLAWDFRLKYLFNDGPEKRASGARLSLPPEHGGSGAVAEQEFFFISEWCGGERGRRYLVVRTHMETVRGLRFC